VVRRGDRPGDLRPERLAVAHACGASVALAASARSAGWAVPASSHARQQSNTDQQIAFRNH
jgi:hypothetical protein